MVIDGPVPNLPATSAQVAQPTTSTWSRPRPSRDDLQAAIYGPWLQIADPASAVPGATKWVPPGGAVLGVWSNNDTPNGVREDPGWHHGPGQARQPRGELHPDRPEQPPVGHGQPDQADAGCRAVRLRRADARARATRTSSSPIERTLQMLIHDLTFLCQFAIFEPNDANLWAQITAVISNYLTQQMQSNVLAGNTPATSFSVLCNSSNNSVSTRSPASSTSRSRWPWLARPSSSSSTCRSSRAPPRPRSRPRKERHARSRRPRPSRTWRRTHCGTSSSR